jgi:8-oxo-dGTP diphosphatase
MSANYSEQNDHPVPCVDAIVFNEKGEILLTRRAIEPYLGYWSIVGGRVEVGDDNTEQTIKREVREETGLEVEIESLVDVFADGILADPRFFIVQILYTAKIVGGTLVSTEEANQFRWASVESASQEKLAFNHSNLLKRYLEKRNSGLLLSARRRYFSEYFGHKHIYNVQNEYVRFAANAIILNDQKEILLAKRCQKPYVGYWDFPGGHIYVGETIDDCLKREVREELGVDAERGKLFHVYSDKGHSPKFADVIAFYFTSIKDFDFKKNVEMEEFGFFSLDNLPAEIAYHNECSLLDIRDYLQKNKI